MWADARRKQASDRMKAYWADGVIRQRRSRSAQKPAMCPDCGETDVSKFYTDAKNRRTNARCKECHKKHCSSAWHSKTPIEKQASRVHSMYGITAQEYIEMHAKQGGKCAICKETPNTKRGLHVDHCHKTGKVRGLLCHGCNVAIGSLKESVETLERAIKYLRG